MSWEARSSRRKSWLRSLIPTANREITSEDIESLRVAMTLLYVRHGYSTSGTLVPDQAIVEGLLHAPGH